MISLPLGSFIDKFNRGLLLSLSGFTGGIIFVLFAFYTEIIGFNLYLLIIIAVLRIFTMDLFRNTNSSILPDITSLVPDKMRGRYFATDSFFTSIFGPLSIVSGILLILVYGIIKTFIISGFIMLLFSLIFLFMKNTFNFNGNKIYNNQ